MSARISKSMNTQPLPPVGGPVKLPTSLPIPVPASRVERDEVRLSENAAKRTEARINAQIEHDRAVLEGRAEVRRKANLDPPRPSQTMEEINAKDAELVERAEERRKANLAPTTSLAASVQGAGNKETLSKINVTG